MLLEKWTFFAMAQLTPSPHSVIVLRDMLKMRLQRIGRKNNPSFRVVVTDSRNAPSRGRNVDLIGSYDPRLDRVEIDAEKAKHWISNGVQVSDTVHNLLVNKNIIEGKKKNVLPRKAPIVDEAKLKAEAEAKAAAEAKAKADAEAAKAAAEAPVAVEAPDAVAEEVAATPEEVPATPETPVEVPEPTPAPAPEITPEQPVEEPKAA
jgi:small subunit ribosomal protein S16